MGQTLCARFRLCSGDNPAFSLSDLQHNLRVKISGYFRQKMAQELMKNIGLTLFSASKVSGTPE
jgi:hypothetical protein